MRRSFLSRLASLFSRRPKARPLAPPIEGKLVDADDMGKRVRRPIVRHILPVPVTDAMRADSDSPIGYLTGLRMDDFLDGLVGPPPLGHGGGGWQNPVTGHGTFGRDKVMQGSYHEPNRLSDPELSALFNGNDLAQRIVMDRPLDSMRRGWCLVVPEDDEDYEYEPVPAEGYIQQPTGGESGAAAPGSPLVDPMGANPDNASGTSVLPEDDDNDPRPKVSPSAQGAKAADSPSSVNNPDDDAPDALKRASDAEPRKVTPADGSPNASAPAAAPTGDGAGKPPAGTDTPMTAKSNRKAVNGGKPDNQGDGADLAIQLEKYAEQRNLRKRFLEAKIFGRLFGGGLLIIGADDGQDMSTPLNEAKIKSVRYLSWMDRRFIFASSWYTEIGPKFGEVETYEIVNPFGGQSNTRVHETRVCRFDGAPVDFLMRRRLLGWSLSVLQAPYDVLRQFDTSFQSVANLMADMSQAVFKINGLMQMISSDPDTLQTRMAMVDMARSTVRAVLLDAENEEFERTATPMTGISDAIEMQMLRVSSAAKEPVSRLFGRQPSGLNATGDADMRNYYDSVESEQKTDDEPKLQRIYTLMALAKDSPLGGQLPQHGLQFVWHKLYAPSEKERSEIALNMAQADSAYVAAQVLLPEEVATSRFRNGDLHLETEIDLELRREALETAELAPSGAEKAKQDQQNKEAELKISATAANAKAGPPGKPGAGKPPAGKPPFGGK